MKYIKKFEKFEDVDYKIKEFIEKLEEFDVITDDNIYFYIIQVIEKYEDYLIIKQLYTYTEGELKSLVNNREFSFSDTLLNYNIEFKSDNVDDCLDYIEAKNQANKYNL